MTLARHRLTALRHQDADIGFTDIDTPNPTLLLSRWYPTEDMTLYDVRGDLGATYTDHGSGLGGTGTTSATYLYDQDIHHLYAGSSSDGYFTIGSAFTHIWTGSHNNVQSTDFSYGFNHLPSSPQDSAR